MGRFALMISLDYGLPQDKTGTAISRGARLKIVGSGVHRWALQ